MFQVSWLVNFKVMRAEEDGRSYDVLTELRVNVVNWAVPLGATNYLRPVQEAGDYVRFLISCAAPY